MSLFLNLLFETDSYSNEYLPAEIGVDTAENEPLEVWGEMQFIIHLPPYARRGGVQDQHARLLRRVEPGLGGADVLAGEARAHGRDVPQARVSREHEHRRRRDVIAA